MSRSHSLVAKLATYRTSEIWIGRGPDSTTTGPQVISSNDSVQLRPNGSTLSTRTSVISPAPNSAGIDHGTRVSSGPLTHTPYSPPVPSISALYRPRKAWAIPPTPRHFDSLNFCKYITKTRLLHGEEGKRELDKYYPPLSFSSAPFIVC